MANTCTHVRTRNINLTKKETTKKDLGYSPIPASWAGWSSLAERERREKGRAGVGKSRIKEEGRVTFYFRRLGRQQQWFW